MADASTGTVVLGGRYRLERLLASGGAAEVWESVDTVLARPVAVKVLHAHLAAQAGADERFRRAASAAARLVHPAIVSIYDARVEGDDAYLVMELVRGSDVRTLLRERGGRLAPRDAVAIAAQVAEALHFAHEHGIVHRDVKPGNILCDGDRAKVADFGIASATRDADVLEDATFAGTTAYLAPEQVTGDPVDRRTDVYALGVLLYELVCGRPPFEVWTNAPGGAHLDRTPPRPRQLVAGVPRGLDDVIVKAMAHAPQERFATAADLRAALLAVDLHDDAVPLVAADPTPPSGLPPAPRPRSRPVAVPALVLAVAALAAVLLGVLLTGALDDDDGRPPGVGVELQRAAIADARSFDPLGDGEEHDDDADEVTDGDPATTWSTSQYRRADFGGLKSGVGIVVELDDDTRVHRIEIHSPTPGWGAEVYVAATPGSTLRAWGAPVAQVRSEREVTIVDVAASVRGRAVLLWLTSLPRDGGGWSATIGELRVLGT